MQDIPHTGHSVQEILMKLPGCEILGTAAKTLAPLTNFPRATPFSDYPSLFIP